MILEISTTSREQASITVFKLTDLRSDTLIVGDKRYYMTDDEFHRRDPCDRG
jgi:hypothetical protein